MRRVGRVLQGMKLSTISQVSDVDGPLLKRRVREPKAAFSPLVRLLAVFKHGLKAQPQALLGALTFGPMLRTCG